MNTAVKMYRILRAGKTERFHKEAWSGMRPLVSEHQNNVAQILLECLGDQCSVELLRAVLQHDLGEAVVGDIPAPTKRYFGKDFCDKLDALESTAAAHLGINPCNLSKEEAQWLAAADLLECFFVVLDQRLLGNMLLSPIARQISRIQEETKLFSCHPQIEEMYYACSAIWRRLDVLPPAVVALLGDDFWNQK